MGEDGSGTVLHVPYIINYFFWNDWGSAPWLRLRAWVVWEKEWPRKQGQRHLVWRHVVTNNLIYTSLRIQGECNLHTCYFYDTCLLSECSSQSEWQWWVNTSIHLCNKISQSIPILLMMLEFFPLHFTWRPWRDLLLKRHVSAHRFSEKKIPTLYDISHQPFGLDSSSLGNFMAANLTTSWILAKTLPPHHKQRATTTTPCWQRFFPTHCNSVNRSRHLTLRNETPFHSVGRFYIFALCWSLRVTCELGRGGTNKDIQLRFSMRLQGFNYFFSLRCLYMLSPLPLAVVWRTGGPIQEGLLHEYNLR